jgi:hypothetical protein
MLRDWSFLPTGLRECTTVNVHDGGAVLAEDGVLHIPECTLR